MLRSKKLGIALFVLSLGVLISIPGAFAKGPPGGTIYAHDVAYRTVGTPTDLPNHGNFDTIYVLGGDLANVSDAAPGDRDYNGGRWEVRPVTWNVEPIQLTNAEQVMQAANAGDLVIGDVVKRFECPLIRK